MKCCEEFPKRAEKGRAVEIKGVDGSERGREGLWEPRNVTLRAISGASRAQRGPRVPAQPAGGGLRASCGRAKCLATVPAPLQRLVDALFDGVYRCLHGFGLVFDAFGHGFHLACTVSSLALARGAVRHLQAELRRGGRPARRGPHLNALRQRKGSAEGPTARPRHGREALGPAAAAVPTGLGGLGGGALQGLLGGGGAGAAAAHGAGRQRRPGRRGTQEALQVERLGGGTVRIE